ncbi:anti sigma factor C-terminal domain-containing protein [Evansella sp. AB-P1]|uniref:anti-sigma factor n=1 Tax=Evansella sp. AB-P1 TaxID=3037653 RepID=UPI00241FF045|nr:anti-sigma factor [Evansella sp. AB-P1]MDG5788223.1 anti sigma factor C-terminal domain-containing protein [Evansella sp. AB-P1]
MTEGWDDKKEKRAIRRYRIHLFVKIFQAMILLFIVYFIYTVSTITIYDNTLKGERLHSYSQLYVDWVLPGVYADFGGGHSTVISNSLTQSTSVPMARRIGKDGVHVGNMSVEKRLLADYTNKHFNYHHPDDRPEFNFYLPEDPRNGFRLDANESRGAWNTLEKVHDGTVADLAFSTNEYYSPEQLFDLLEGIDVDVIWIPLYLGELQIFEEGWMMGGNSISVSPWGLTHGRGLDENYFMGYTAFLARETLEENRQFMIENMERLYEDDPKLAEAVFHTSYFEERLNYLKENDFQVYGAVVTGPTKELLKLKGIEEIRGVQLGEIDYWNWEE